MVLPDLKSSSPLSSTSQIAPPSFTALAFMLAALAMLGPFSVDTYLPAFPQIERGLHATSIEVQQTLTAYMFAFSIMVLWHGPLSDAFGRRKIILSGLVVFAIASVGCAMAPSVEFLWFFRILQGLSSGAGTVVGRAIVRDMYEGAPATRLMSLTTMIFSIAPAIAPIIGGAIISVADWHTIFVVLFVYTLLLLAYCYRYLPESLPLSQRQPFYPRLVAASLAEIFRSPMFYLRAGVIALNFSGFFLYVASAPVFIVRHLHLGPHQFAWLFIPAVCGMFLGSLIANRLAGKMAVNTQVHIGFACMLVAATFNYVYHMQYAASIPWSVMPLLLFTTGSAIIAPSVTLMVLDMFPHIRGTAASCQSFLLTMLASIIAGLLAPLLSDSVLHLAIGQLSMTLLSLLLWKIAIKPKPRR